jgi:DNA-binding protein Fis
VSDLPRVLLQPDLAAAAALDLESDRQWLELIRTHLSSHAGPRAHEQLLERIERLLLTEALKRTRGNQTHAARLLGLARPTLHAKMQKFGLRDLPDDWQS